MDHSGLVRGLKRLSDLLGDGQRLVDGDRALGDSVRQGRAFDQFEDERLDAVRLFQAMDAAYVGMVQRGQDFGFAFKPGEAIRIGRECFGQHLQRHISVEFGVAGSIYLTLSRPRR